MTAAHHGHAFVLGALIEAGADVHTQDKVYMPQSGKTIHKFFVNSAFLFTEWLYSTSHNITTRPCSFGLYTDWGYCKC